MTGLKKKSFFQDDNQKVLLQIPAFSTQSTKKFFLLRKSFIKKFSIDTPSVGFLKFHWKGGGSVMILSDLTLSSLFCSDFSRRKILLKAQSVINKRHLICKVKNIDRSAIFIQIRRVPRRILA